MTATEILGLIRDVPDFPKPGIVFKDITPVLSHARAFSRVIELLSAKVPPGITQLAAIESRGFILGAAMAQHLKLGLTLIRKPGKLPYATLSHAYDLEYGQDRLHIHVDAVTAQDQVCIVDDVLATGGTAHAAEVLVQEAGGRVNGFVFLMELGFLKGRERLRTKPIESLFTL